MSRWVGFFVLVAVLFFTKEASGRIIRYDPEKEKKQFTLRKMNSYEGYEEKAKEESFIELPQKNADNKSLLNPPNKSSIKAWSTPASTSKTSLQLYFGGFFAPEWFFLHNKRDFNYAFGGYLGIESNFGNPYISLLTTFSLSYHNYFLAHKNEWIHRQMIISPLLQVGLRAYFGVPYIFFDLLAGASFILPRSYIPSVSITGALGVNIPFSDTVFMQIIGEVSYLPPFFQSSLKLGLSIKI